MQDSLSRQLLSNQHAVNHLQLTSLACQSNDLFDSRIDKMLKWLTVENKLRIKKSFLW
jgi:hypothetical protein